MFDIGFAEVLIVAILGLIILGPERLPGAIRTAALWVGRFKRSYRKIRNDIEQEIGADDIRRQLYNEEIVESLKESGEQFKALKDSAEMELNAIQDSKPRSKQQQDAVHPSE